MSVDVSSALHKKIVPLLPLQSLKVLVVEDCEENRFLFDHLLSRRGALVTVAEDGLAGTEIALKEHFDVVLMDIRMPVLDGYAAIEKLRAANYLQPVIALTAHTKPEELLKISQAGFAMYIAKPVDVSDLISSIVRVCQREVNND